MEEEQMKQIVAELIAAEKEALGMLVLALSRQLDPAELFADLQATIASAKAFPSGSSLAIHLMTDAVAAAESMAALRNPEVH